MEEQTVSIFRPEVCRLKKGLVGCRTKESRFREAINIKIHPDNSVGFPFGRYVYSLQERKRLLFTDKIITPSCNDTPPLRATSHSLLTVCRDPAKRLSSVIFISRNRKGFHRPENVAFSHNSISLLK
jgi:hypothetical protein